MNIDIISLGQNITTAQRTVLIRRLSARVIPMLFETRRLRPAPKLKLVTLCPAVVRPPAGRLMISRIELIRLTAPIYRVLSVPPQALSVRLTMAWVILLVTLNVKPVMPSLTMPLICSLFSSRPVRRTEGFPPRRKASTHRALAVCDMTVASAAPETPIPKV